MLKLLRRGVKTWVAKILLGLLILSFAIWGIGDIFLGRTESAVAAVGNTEVDANRYMQMVRRQQLQMTVQRQQGVTLADLRAAGIDRQILSTLVREAAYSEELELMDVQVATESVAEAIRRNPAFLDTEGRFDPNRYRDRLNQIGYSGPEYELSLRGALAQTILADAVSVGTLPAGVAETIARWQGEMRGVSTLALTPDAAPEPAEPADDQLQAFFAIDSAAFREPERRWGRYIRLIPAQLAKDIELTDEEIETEYKARIDSYSVAPARTVEQIVFPDEATAAEAARRIEAEEAGFAEVAAEQNISVANLSLGSVGLGELPEAVDKAVFAIEEPGIVGPVKVLDGFALLNVTAVVTGSTRPLDEVRDDVAKGLALRHAQGLARKKATEIDEIRAGGATLEEIASRLGVEVAKFSGLAGDGTVVEGDVPALAADPRFVAEVAAASVGQERDVIELVDGGYALVMLDRVAEEHLPEFTTVRDKVAEAWKTEERMKALEARAVQLVTEAGAEGLPAIGTVLGEEPVELPAMLRNQIPQMIGTELSERIFKAEQGDIVLGRTAGSRSVLIVLVREIVALEGDALAERTKAIADGFNRSIAQDSLELYGRSLERRHGATFSQSAVDSVFERLGQIGY